MTDFLPIFVVNRTKLIEKLKSVDGRFGILSTFAESDQFLHKLRYLEKPYFIDSGVFEKPIRPDYEQINIPWYCQIDCRFEENRWIRKTGLASHGRLKETIAQFLHRCDRFSPDYVMAPDVLGEPLLSLYLARIAWQEYCCKSRSYQLVGVVQVGDALYNWRSQPPQKDAFFPHYRSPKSFLAPLISEYRSIGYQYIALGGLLKAKQNMPGWTFGLSNEALDELLTWSRPNLVLGGLALTRLSVLKKHRVWADSSGWIWWDSRYDRDRFENWDALRSVLE